MVIGIIAAMGVAMAAAWGAGSLIGEIVARTQQDIMGSKAMQGLVAVAQLPGTMAKGTSDIVQSAVDAATGTAEAVSSVAETVSGTVSNVGETISETVGGVSGSISQGFQNIAEVPVAITGAITGIPEAISSKVTEPVTKIITYPTEFIAAKETQAGLPGGTGLLIIGGLGLGAAYLLFKKKGKVS